ncbi:MAG: LCP family protein [Candidatus Bipolaricaulota bacterium]|nr:LCP family protein [Candidatus Bipolaricaulota bacterium]MBS3791533.1 LCP family protein [Candidatus Bipolaricaulota bacterium]
MKWKITISIVLVVLLVGSGIGIYLLNQRDVNELVKKGERINLLVLGIDHIEGAQARRSDTMMLASIDTAEGKASLISIPRDLFLKYPDDNFRRVNAAYAIDGPELARELASNFLGVPMNFYLVLDYEGFKEIVDLMGGVEITVEERLQYTDEAGDLNIDIDPGRQTLNGEEAMGYVRYRGDQSDLQRINRQQKFLRALLQGGVNLEGWSQIKDVINTGRKYAKTNLSLMDMYDLGRTLKDLGTEDFEMVTLSGKPARVENKSVLLPRIVETRKVVAQEINGVNMVGNADAKVYILNGEGSNYLARNTADRLTSLGFSVTGTDNADRFDYETSYLVTLNDEGEEMADLVAQELDFNPEIVSAENFQETMTSLEGAGVDPTPETNLLLIMGEGSPDFVS